MRLHVVPLFCRLLAESFSLVPPSSPREITTQSKKKVASNRLIDADVQSTGFAGQLSAVIYNVSERPLSTASYFRLGSRLCENSLTPLRRSR